MGKLGAGGERAQRGPGARGLVVSTGAGAIAGLWLWGCGAPVFECEQASQCRGADGGGLCQPDGYCSFPDEGCPSGQRYGEHAGGGVAGACVPPSEGSGTTAPGSSSGVVPGTTGDGTTLPLDGGSSTSPTGPGESSGAPVCGGLGEPCCAGSTCSEGLCVGSACEPCVAWVEAEEHTTCARRNDGLLSCWGDDADGQVGDGAPSVGAGIPVPVAILASVTDVDLGAFHACALAGEPWCWGRNQDGQLGLGVPGGDEPEPVAIDAPEPLASIAAGGFHTCALGRSGQAYCWGHNANGQVGMNGELTVPLPQAVPMLPDVVAIDAGGFHACAIDRAAQVWCWGSNEWAQIGQPFPIDGEPDVVTGLPDVRQLALGDHHSCALDDDGNPWCWGRNNHGQLAASPFVFASPMPRLVEGLPPLVELGSGDDHVCGVTEAGEVWCWGSNADGQLGPGGGDVHEPTQLASPAALHVTGGRGHTCITATDGTAWCLGHNHRGQLGDGTTVDASDPVRVPDACPR